MNNKENINKNFFLKHLNKFIIIFIYIFIFAFFLYLPNFLNLFSKRDNVINVYTFTDMISPETAHDFEKQTDIKINLKIIINLFKCFKKKFLLIFS
ncbi:hypothetical protein KKE07_02820, partial [Candidatus Dependentiae bacterium]|nr:hypothetical protein [Candidatus Dependentiae bacterium]